MAGSQQFNFGSGFLYGVPLAGTDLTPVLLGTLQDCSYDISSTIKELYGQLQFPVAVGRGPAKFTGKAAMGAFSAKMWNTFFFGPGLDGTSQLPTTVGAVEGINNEVMSMTSQTAQFSKHSVGTFDTDLGLFYTLTGALLKKVASAPTTGQYSVDASGNYTVAAADTAANAANGVTCSYTYLPTTPTSKIQSINNNQLPMGSAPAFMIVHNVPYATGGTAVTLKIYSAIASKLSIQFKNQDFTVPNIDFEMFANSAGKVLDIVTSV
jgi:hypothetical protein